MRTQFGGIHDFSMLYRICILKKYSEILEVLELDFMMDPGAIDRQYHNMSNTNFLLGEGLNLATVRVSLDSGNVARFEVNLGALRSSKTGREVTVKFRDPKIDNKGVFYTDSNGLEMVKRTLKTEPTF